MRKNPEVCFQVDEMKDQANWKSVIVWGSYEEITNELERYYAMKFLVSRLMHERVSETARLPHDIHTMINAHDKPDVIRPIVYRSRVKERSGRYEVMS